MSPLLLLCLLFVGATAVGRSLHPGDGSEPLAKAFLAHFNAAIASHDEGRISSFIDPYFKMYGLCRYKAENREEFIEKLVYLPSNAQVVYKPNTAHMSHEGNRAFPTFYVYFVNFNGMPDAYFAVENNRLTTVAFTCNLPVGPQRLPFHFVPNSALESE